jgi:glycine cleavage system regulatory protein
MHDVVLTLLGPDRPGMVESVADAVARLGGNWLESRMAHLAGKFAGILRVEVPPDQFAALVKALEELESTGLKIMIERSEPVPEAIGTRTIELDLLGLDRPGIVRAVSQLLVQNGGNVEELRTDRSSAPMSGDLLFRANIRVAVPAEVDLSRLRAGLERLGDDLIVELRQIESVKASGPRKVAGR